MSKHHSLKIRTEYFEEILAGNKLFEIRYNDRDFKRYDTVTLREWNPDMSATGTSGFTGRFKTFVIGYISMYAQKENWVVFSLKEYEVNEK